ncbi:MAG: thiamine pyrophosphate-dependent enzyme, partial [Sterolibacterium sp.]
RFIREHKLNEFFPGDFAGVGLILQGGLYNGVIRALQLLGLSDSFGNTRIPLYVMNVTYPVIDEEVVGFCRDKRAVLMLEEGQPEYIEQNLHAILRKAGVTAHLSGKDLLPMAGEYTTVAIRDGLKNFLQTWQPSALPGQNESRSKPGPAVQPIVFHPKVRDLANVVPPRPAGFCTGCPERPIFAAMKLVEQDLGQHHISCDIGCHLFSILPPFHLGATTMGYGLGAASNSAFNVRSGKRSISVMGDGGFWHNGLTSGIGNAVFNKNDGVVIIIDNFYSSATGGQDILSSRATNPDRATNNPIADALRGVGVKWLRTIDRTYDVRRLRETLEEALTTTTDGPKVIVAQSECMLNKQRRIKPLFNKALKAGERVVKERFGVDPDVCSGDHACIRLSGCPSLTLKDSGDPLKEDPVAYVDNSCVACGNCGEVAEAAILCPSFYRTEVVHNPGRFERLRARFSLAVIGWLQRRRAARLERCAF